MRRHLGCCVTYGAEGGIRTLNPYGTAAPGARANCIGTINWIGFKEFLEQTYRPITAKSRFQYAKKYYELLLRRDFSVLHKLSAHKKVHILKTLAVLSKYLGIYNVFKLLMKQYSLKWSTNDRDDVIIARMMKPIMCGSVVGWIGTELFQNWKWATLFICLETN